MSGGSWGSVRDSVRNQERKARGRRFRRVVGGRIANKTNPATGETAARVLLFDVETSPNIGYTWGKWEQNVIEFIKERQIICFSWKWLGEKKSKVLALPDFPGYKRDPDSNKALILALHKLFSRADIIVGHNIDKFDDRRANTDFFKHGLTPPPPHKTVDTLKVARSKFDLNSNKLNDLGAFLGVGQKVKHGGFVLWLGCMKGDPKAWALMKKYNRGDVDLLERVYLRERPWMTNHPALKPRGDNSCPACQSKNIISRGSEMTRAGRVPRIQCNDCGKWSRVVLMKKAWVVK